MIENNFHAKAGPFTVKELAEKIGATIKGDGNRRLCGVAPLDKATADDLSFLDNPKYKTMVSDTKAGAVIITEENSKMLPDGVVALLTNSPYAVWAKALAEFHPSLSDGLIHPSAVIEPSAKIGEGVSIGANCYIGENVSIGDGTVVMSNVTIICAHIGAGCLVHAGVRIGQDGFGFAFDGKGLVKVPQVGCVRIGNLVEIGANSTIDRGALGDTIIGDMTKIDCLVQIGHNVKIGRMCQIVAQTGVAGSTELGDGVVLGGQSAVAGHLKIASRVMAAGRSGITKNIDKIGEVVGGFPAQPIAIWRKQQAVVSRLLKKK